MPLGRWRGSRTNVPLEAVRMVTLGDVLDVCGAAGEVALRQRFSSATTIRLSLSRFTLLSLCVVTICDYYLCMTGREFYTCVCVWLILLKLQTKFGSEGGECEAASSWMTVTVDTACLTGGGACVILPDTFTVA